MKLMKMFLVLYFLHQQNRNKPGRKKIKFHVLLVANTTALKKLRTSPTTFSTIAGKVSAAFSAILLKMSLHLLMNQKTAGPPPSAKRPLIPSTGTITIHCSQNNVRILSAKNLYISRTFLTVCHIIAGCIGRIFPFCESILSLSC